MTPSTFFPHDLFLITFLSLFLPPLPPLCYQSSGFAAAKTTSSLFPERVDSSVFSIPRTHSSRRTHYVECFETHPPTPICPIWVFEWGARFPPRRRDWIDDLLVRCACEGRWKGHEWRFNSVKEERDAFSSRGVNGISGNEDYSRVGWMTWKGFRDSSYGGSLTECTGKYKTGGLLS